MFSSCDDLSLLPPLTLKQKQQKRDWVLAIFYLFFSGILSLHSTILQKTARKGGFDFRLAIHCAAVSQFRFLFLMTSSVGIIERLAFCAFLFGFSVLPFEIHVFYLSRFLCLFSLFVKIEGSLRDCVTWQRSRTEWEVKRDSKK
jgi:hypothetical protein